MKKYKTSISLTENNKELIEVLQNLGKLEYNANISMSTIINLSLYCFFNKKDPVDNEIDYYSLLEFLKCQNQL